MKEGDGGFAPCYNVQISTHAERRIIVGVEVTQSGSDYQQLEPALETIQQNLGRAPKQMVVDGGYTSSDNIVALAEKKIELIGSLGDEEGRSRAALQRLGIAPEFRPEAFVAEPSTRTLPCPNGKTLRYVGQDHTHGYLYHRYRASGQDCSRCPWQPRCCPRQPERGRLVSIRVEAPEVTAFRQKMATGEAQTIYKQRPGVAETPHAWIKDKFGLRQFRLRGLAKVCLEALWACLAYNILQWIRCVWRKVEPAVA